MKFLCDEYDLIVGIWTLCYLGPEDLWKYAQQMYATLKEGGTVILNEPILTNQAELSSEKLHDELEQQLIIRTPELYKNLFTLLNFEIVESHCIDYEGASEKLIWFILKKTSPKVEISPIEKKLNDIETELQSEFVIKSE